MHLSRTLSPTSLWVGATISRIFRHPNKSEIKGGISFFCFQRYFFYSFEKRKTVGITVYINFPHTYLNVWTIIWLGTRASNYSWWYYFLFPPPIIFLFQCLGWRKSLLTFLRRFSEPGVISTPSHLLCSRFILSIIYALSFNWHPWC